MANLAPGGGHPPPTDVELLTASGHDPAAFRQLYDRYAQAVEAFFRRRTGSRDDALDLTAETFAASWLSRARFDDRCVGSAAPWLFGIARNVLRHSVPRARIESSARQRLGLLVAAERATVAAPGAWLDGADNDLDPALDALPAGQHRALRLRVVDDLPYDAVAEQLDCSPTAARIRVSRGLSALRDELEERRDG